MRFKFLRVFLRLSKTHKNGQKKADGDQTETVYNGSMSSTESTSLESTQTCRHPKHLSQRDSKSSEILRINTASRSRQIDINPDTYSFLIFSNNVAFPGMFWACRIFQWTVILWLASLWPITLVYALSFIFLHRIVDICMPWFDYISDDFQARQALRMLRSYVRFFIAESEKATSGDYSRQVIAAYIIYNCTAPGESYLSYAIRYRMSKINSSVIQELEERRERRLGYELSRRNVFQ